MTTKPDALQRAIDYLGAVECKPGRYAIKGEIDGRWYVTSAAGLADIHEASANENYREEKPPTKMPSWWSPEQRFAIDSDGAGRQCTYATRDEAEFYRGFGQVIITANLETGQEELA